MTEGAEPADEDGDSRAKSAEGSDAEPAEVSGTGSSEGSGAESAGGPGEESAGGPGAESAGGPGAESAGGRTSAASADGRTYGGLLGAFPYAFRASDSLLCRTYVVVGGLVAALLSLLFGLALVLWVAATVRAPASVTLSRAFLLLLWLALFAPLVAPVLLVARRHRRGRTDARYDAAVAACGYLFLGAAYAGLVVGAPGRVVPDAYRAAGALPPLLAVALLVAVHRRLG